VAADGTAGVAITTKVTLTFDQDVSGLAAGDVAIGAAYGTPSVTVDGLSALGEGVYELEVSGDWDEGDQILLTPSQDGYRIEPSSRSVTLHADTRTPIALESVTADGTTGTATTTKITLTFDQNVSGLAAGDITLTPGAGADTITAGTLTSLGSGVYELEVSGDWDEAGKATVAVAKAGYTFTPGSIEVTLHADTRTPVAFNSVAADGTAGTSTTTKITLTFDKDITGLAAGDITLTPGAGADTVTAGTLTSLGSGVYELEINGDWDEAGKATVAVGKAGYTFTPASHEITLHRNNSDDPDGPDNPDSPGNPDVGDSRDGGKMPFTGADVFYPLALSAIMLLTGCGLGVWRRRRKQGR
jgi:hypothetical protein